MPWPSMSRSCSTTLRKWSARSPECASSELRERRRAFSPSCWKGCTPTTAARFWTTRGLRSGRATTAPCRSWTPSGCRPPPAPRSACTIPGPRWMPSSKGYGKPGRSFSDVRPPLPVPGNHRRPQQASAELPQAPGCQPGSGRRQSSVRGPPDRVREDGGRGDPGDRIRGDRMRHLQGLRFPDDGIDGGEDRTGGGGPVREIPRHGRRVRSADPFGPRQTGGACRGQGISRTGEMRHAGVAYPADRAENAGRYRLDGVTGIPGAPPDIILDRGGADMERESARTVMERRYGELDSGRTTLRIAGREYRLREILARWMLDVEGVLSIDGGELGGGRYWIRFLDGDDRRYVVFEFDTGFDILSEMRADSLLWEGDDFFFSRS